jgi:hypothetical protein
VVVWEGTRTGAVKDPQFEADCQILLEIVAKGAVPAESGKAAAKAAGLKEGKRYYLAKAAVITTYRPMGVAETVWLWRRKDSLALPGEVIKPPEEQAPSRG